MVARRGPRPAEGTHEPTVRPDEGDDGFFATAWSYTGTLGDRTCDGDEILVDTDSESVSIGPCGTPTACSVEQGAFVTVAFENAPTGTENRYAAIEPGAVHVQPTDLRGPPVRGADGHRAPRLGAHRHRRRRRRHARDRVATGLCGLRSRLRRRFPSPAVPTTLCKLSVGSAVARFTTARWAGTPG